MIKVHSRKLPLAFWIAIVVAVIVGIWAFLQLFIISAYNIPTGAMEKTIRVGDRVLVSKLNYHPISRGDILVFHFPAGDTVISLPEYRSAYPYYDVIRHLGNGNADSGRQIVLANPNQYPLSIRPVNRREHYIKRCIALPGDTLEVRDERVYIDGQGQAWPPKAETLFHVVIAGRPFDAVDVKEKYDIDMTNAEECRPLDSAGVYDMLLTWNAREKMLKDGYARRISPIIETSTEGIWPGDESRHWTTDNYGPLWVPRKGGQVQLTPSNYPLYERIIRTYEGNQLERRGDRIFVNGHEEKSYTFKMNYYWVIGDNLHASQDSRYWGFVPEDHLIGKVRGK